MTILYSRNLASETKFVLIRSAAVVTKLRVLVYFVGDEEYSSPRYLVRHPLRNDDLLDIILVSLLASSGSQTTPTLPGGIIAWIVCNGRKRNPIGGWLLFYYWQLYSTFVLSAVFFGTNIQSYVPENFEDKARFAVFLITVVPGLLLLFTQVCVATFSLGVQTPDMLKLLRGILIAQALASVLEVVLGAQFFPNTEFLPILMLIQEGLWLAYFFRSSRVRHVFSLQDWETAVNLIYPAKLDLST